MTQHKYTMNSLFGGHVCPSCDGVNTCFFYSGYYIELPDGMHEHHNMVECEECGYQHEVVWSAMPLPLARKQSS